MMPEKLISKKVKKTEEIAVIMQLFKESLDYAAVAQNSLNPREFQSSSGLIALFLNALNFQVGKAWTLGFGEMVIALDSDAEKLKDSYLFALNQILRQEGYDAKTLENPEINDEYVLIYEILRRYVITAFSVNRQNYEEGKKIIASLEHFIHLLLSNDSNQSNLLCRKSADYYSSSLSQVTECLSFNDKKYPSELKIYLAQDHHQWIGLMKEVIQLLELLHGPGAAVNKIRDYLRISQKIIKRQLIGFLNPQVTLHELADDQLPISLQLSEKNIHRFIEQKLKSSSKTLVHPMTREFLLAHISELGMADLQIQHIKRLYRLLDRTVWLSEIVDAFDFLIQASGWILILCGELHPEILSDLVYEHCLLCSQWLTVDRKKYPELFSQIGNVLIHYQALQFNIGEKVAFEGIKCLRGLIEDRQMQSIVAHALRKITDLNSLQKLASVHLIGPSLLQLIRPLSKGRLSYPATVSSLGHASTTFFSLEKRSPYQDVYSSSHQPLDLLLQKEADSSYTVQRYFDLARRHNKEGQYHEALQSVEQSLSFSPMPQTFYLQAFLLSKMGHYDRAQSVVKKLLTQYPKDPSLMRLQKEIQFLQSHHKV